MPLYIVAQFLLQNPLGALAPAVLNHSVRSSMSLENIGIFVLFGNQRLDLLVQREPSGEPNNATKLAFGSKTRLLTHQELVLIFNGG